ncbi:MAG: hypothetical protein AAGF74_02175 [Pseudomonadota bacterium]
MEWAILGLGLIAAWQFSLVQVLRKQVDELKTLETTLEEIKDDVLSGRLTVENKISALMAVGKIDPEAVKTHLAALPGYEDEDTD